MNIIKFKTAQGWISLYQSFMKNFLRKSSNLSDVDNKEEARNNLELTGNDNHTHYHDDRYIPMIDGAKDTILAEVDQIKNQLDIKIKNIDASTNQNTTIIESKLDKDLIAIGPTAPVNPKNKTIWFYINTETKRSYIKVWHNGQWYNMGAFWK